MSERDQDKGNLRVCTKCLGDKEARSWILNAGRKGQCDFEPEHGRSRKTLPVSELAELVGEYFVSKYQIGEEIPQFSGDSDKLWYAQDGEPYKDILSNELLCSEEIIEAISDFLPSPSHREIQKGADVFFDGTYNYSLLNGNDDGDGPYDSSGNGRPQSRAAESIRYELLSKISELHIELAKLESPPAGLGHNRPPEPIDPVPSHADLQRITKSLQVIKDQADKPNPDHIEQVRAAAVTVQDTANGLQRCLSKIGQDVVSGAAKQGGKRLLDLALGAAAVHHFWEHLVQLANQVVSLTFEFLAAMPNLF